MTEEGNSSATKALRHQDYNIIFVATQVVWFRVQGSRLVAVTCGTLFEPIHVPAATPLPARRACEADGSIFSIRLMLIVL